jgi:hypothetical protein
MMINVAIVGVPPDGRWLLTDHVWEIVGLIG